MKTIKLYRFKDSVMRKMPLFNEGRVLSSLNELMGLELINTEKVTEFTIEVEEEFDIENCSRKQLVALCDACENFIEHHFITTTNDYDVI